MSEPVTRAELEAVLATFAKQIASETASQIASQIAAAESRLEAKIERVETSLLTAFHGWARPTEIKLRTFTTQVTGFDERVSLLEERLTDVERRLRERQPPAA